MKPIPLHPFPRRVRLAEVRDEAAIFEILTIGLANDNSFGVSHDAARIKAQIQLGTRRQGGIIGLIEDDGKIVGTVGVFMQSYWYSATTFLAELWLFVDPAYRGRGYDDQLFRFLHWYQETMSTALGHSITLVSSVSSPRRLEAKERLWRMRLGATAKKVGAIFSIG